MLERDTHAAVLPCPLQATNIPFSFIYLSLKLNNFNNHKHRWIKNFMQYGEILLFSVGSSNRFFDFPTRQTSLVAQQPPIRREQGSFIGLKRPERDKCSLSRGTEVNNGCIYTSTLAGVLMKLTGKSWPSQTLQFFFISSFHCVLNVVCTLLGCSPACGFLTWFIRHAPLHSAVLHAVLISCYID
jgi:hypothetical protein